MLILFFIFSLLILFSTLGYGLITIRLLKFERLNLNYGIIGIFGLFLLSIVSKLKKNNNINGSDVIK